MKSVPMETIFGVDRLILAYLCDLTSHSSLGYVLPDPTKDHFRIKSTKGKIKNFVPVCDSSCDDNIPKA